MSVEAGYWRMFQVTTKSTQRWQLLTNLTVGAVFFFAFSDKRVRASEVLTIDGT